MTFLVDPPTNDHSVALADWIELKAIAEGTSRLSRSVLKHQLRDALGAVGGELEELVDLTLSEMQRRSDLVGTAYPFSENQSGFELRDEVSPAYRFLLLIACSSHFRARNEQREVSVGFETLLVQSLQRYLGTHGRAVRFGTPPTGDRPHSWEDAIRWLAGLLGVGLGPGPIPREETRWRCRRCRVDTLSRFPWWTTGRSGPSYYRDRVVGEQETHGD